jgi:hypothetical protein
MNRSKPVTTIGAGIALVALAAILVGWAAPRASAAPIPTPTKQAAASAAPFAKVYLALRGCTSCAHCRTTIRQMAKGSAKGGETHVNGDRVEVLYPKPRLVPLRDVIKALAENRLHDLNLVDVLFDARGSFTKDAGGALRFTLAETGQTFPVSVAASMERPSDGREVRLIAVVDGWREKGGLTLVAREIRPAA